MGFFDFIPRVKKKLTDTIGGLGAVANTFRNDLGNDISSGVQGVKSVGSAVANVPDRLSGYFNNDATYGGIVKNTLSPDNLSKSLYDAPQYNFADSVTWKNPVKKVGAELAQGTLNTFHNVRDYSKEAADQYYGAKPADTEKLIGSGVSAALSLGGLMGGGKAAENLGREGVAAVTEKQIPKVTELIKSGAKQGLKYGGAFGGASGAAESMKQGADTGDVVKSAAEGAAAGAVTGGALGAAIPVAGALPGAVKNTAKNLTEKPKIDLIPEHYVKTDTVSGVVNGIPGVDAKQTASFPKAPEGVKYGPARATGRETMFQTQEVVRDAYKVVPEQRVVRDARPTVGDLFQGVNKALPRLGMNIEDVSGVKPPVVPTHADVIAAKNRRAGQIVRNQQNLQRSGSQVAEPGFVPPARIKTPQRAKMELIPKAPKVETPAEKFSRELDSIPYPNERPKVAPNRETPSVEPTPTPSVEKPVLYADMPANIRAIKENVDNGVLVGPKAYAKLRQWEERKAAQAADPFGTQNGPYNKYQQDAYNAKQERIQALREIITAPETLRAMGFTKKQASKFSVEDARIISELGKLGYPKDDPILRDLHSEMVKRILENKVTHLSLKEYYARSRALNTHVLDGMDPKLFSDISPLQAGTRDLYRNFETVFGGKYNDPTFQKVKSELLDPFDASKGAFIEEQQQKLAELEKNIVKGLGIKKGSKESAAVQLFGEGKMTLEQLKEQFPKKWENIVKANEWFRNMYDSMIEETNRVREYYFPTHPLYPESTKVIPKRANYYRHFQEMADGFKGLMNIFDTPANIDPSLAVSSEFTKPKTKWLSFAQKRNGEQTTNDAVGGFLDYIKANAYAKHIDPHIQRFRGVDAELKSKAPRGTFFDDSRIGLAEELSKKIDPFQQIAEMKDASKIKNFLIEKGLQDRDALAFGKELVKMKDAAGVKDYLTKNLTPEGMNEFNAKALAEDSGNKLNNFLKFLDNFANDLAGKTNPLDRPFQDNLIGRPMFRAINWLNSRVKANTILGNVSSTLSQLFNVPQGIADAGVVNSTKAIGDSLAGIFVKDTPMAQSSFMNERYFDDFSKFDTGMIDNTKNFAAWITSVGDEIGTKFVWNAEYRKALEVGAADPVKYADDWTRRMVQGRGVGEVPILQKSKITQLFVPFQLEVAGLWRVFGDWARNDPSKLAVAKKLLVYSVASYLMNAAKREITGSDTSFDPLNALIEGVNAYQKEKDKLTGALKAGGRMAGEVFSNIPGGQSIASIYPEFGNKDVLGSGIDIPTRTSLFGKGDPTRFGGGPLITKAITDPLYSLMPPFGGQQVKKTLGGAESIAQGYATSGSGNVTTPVAPDVTNVMKGLLFGKNALSEVQDAHAGGQAPLSADQSEKFKLLGNDKGYFDSVMAGRTAEQEKKAIKDGKIPGVMVADAQTVGEGVTPLSDGTYFVKNIGKNGTTFDTPEEAQFAIVKDSFLKSDKNIMEYNGTVLRKYRNASGQIDVTPMSKGEFDSKLNEAQLTSFQKDKNLKGWMDTAQKQFEVLNARMNDPLTDDLEKIQIQNQVEKLVSDYSKFQSYGGFTKGKAVAEKYKYPLVDPEWLKTQALIAGTGPKKFRLTKKILPLVVRRLPTVHRTRRR